MPRPRSTFGKSQLGSEQRSREARQRAEEVLVRFALLVGDHTQDFVVIGGLNPDFLAPAAPVPHLGTTDVDLVFELGFVYDRDERDFAWLDEALAAGGFIAAPNAAGWQWNGVLGPALVRLDLLCDVSDSPGQTIALPGATEAAVQNLDGPVAALSDPIYRTLSVPPQVRSDIPNAPEEIGLKFASLGGYIASKSAALLARELEKDAYDLMYVVMYAPGGAAAASAATSAVRVPIGRAPVAPTVRSAIARFVDPSSSWTGLVVRDLVGAGDESDPDQLRADVSVAAARFLAELQPSAGSPED